MRLFVSLRPPAAACEHLAAALRGVRTTRVDQWHVTLAFLGEVPDPEPLLGSLRTAAERAQPLHLQLRGSGFFRGPGVLFAGVSGDVDPLHRLAADVTAVCRDAGVHLEPRPYRPHLTVARRLPRDPGTLSQYEGPPWTATEVELVRSRLGARVEHEVLERFELGG